jgi:hypothetical protein
MDPEIGANDSDLPGILEELALLVLVVRNQGWTDILGQCCGATNHRQRQSKRVTSDRLSYRVKGLRLLQ